MSVSEMADRLARGISAARAGNRLVARLHLEQAFEGGLREPELLLWLAWVSESPDRAREHLRSLEEVRDYKAVARGALSWLDVLSKGLSAIDAPPPSTVSENAAGLMPFAGIGSSAREDRLPPIYDPLPAYDKAFPVNGSDAGERAAAALLSTTTFRTACPNCDAKLEVGASALGQPRFCPACQLEVIIPMIGEGAEAVSAAECPQPWPTIPSMPSPAASPVASAKVDPPDDDDAGSIFSLEVTRPAAAMLPEPRRAGAAAPLRGHGLPPG